MSGAEQFQRVPSLLASRRGERHDELVRIRMAGELLELVEDLVAVAHED